MAFVPAPGYHPAYCPLVPYVTSIPGGLRPGVIVYIRGTLAKSCTRFTVNFATGQYDGCDIALHMNPRYDGLDRVIFNNFLNSQWGEEEKKKGTPFKSGKQFELVFQITKNNYQVTVDGKPYHEYAHHIPMERINWLQVKGDIVLQAVSIMGYDIGQVIKGGLGALAPTPGGPLPPMNGPVWSNPTIPFTAHIPGGMIPKRTLVVKGYVPSGAKSFAINFKVATTGDIAFHINPRISKHALVRNSFINGVWGEEETEVTQNPLKKEEHFDLSVRSGDKRFKVYINGHHIFNFELRFKNVQQIDTFEIQGDVQVAYVYF
ncbi:galectin-4 [Microcaecilia unicolor]|uniref:Galectin n=1 Tax=Microcaecilia unicolor TaxID=1415580 RepID=A0A6P7ZFN9_9AMPH|nr:galectin-4-like [Microcaecilia unicolor]